MVSYIWSGNPEKRELLSLLMGSLFRTPQDEGGFGIRGREDVMIRKISGSNVIGSLPVGLGWAKVGYFRIWQLT